MKLNARNWLGAACAALGLSSTLVLSARGLEPETLFNFQGGLDTVFGSLVQGPDGNFYGTTPRGGGPLRTGTIFRVTPTGVLTILASDQDNPAAGLIVGNDGLIYGMTSAGGTNGFGTAFRMTTSGTVTNFVLLDGVNGRSPLAGLVLAGDGNFYGTSQSGGTFGLGSIFRISPGGVVTLLVSFDASTIGAFPDAGLTLGPDGNLYGVTSFFDNANQGTIFKMTTSGNLTTLHPFQATEGSGRQARLTLGPDRNLYGTTSDGGTSNLGTIFKITTNGVFTTLVSFNGANGAVPTAELTSGPGGQLFGTTQQGGSANVGTVFKVTTNGVLTTLATFTSAANGMPQSGLLLASNGNFYGCSQGTVFKMTPAGALTTLVSLYPLDGEGPSGGLILGADGNFYGTTFDGGTNNAGTIFRMTADGALTSLFSFNGTNGFGPRAGLAIGKDGNFYGTTSRGGQLNSGTVFRFSTNGTLTTLGSFNGTNGANPQCQLVMDADGNFYGTAPEAGPNFLGTIFRVSTDGVLSTLVAFNQTNGASPQCDGLALGNDGNFYGTTADGGTSDLGTVFKVTPGGDLTTLASFNLANGSQPQGGLVLGADGNFYGGAAFGGPFPGNFGNVYKVTTNGELTPLFNFHATDGQEPTARLIQANDGSLYGTTVTGGSTNGLFGSSGFGTVFRITTNGVFTSLVQFQNTNGSGPLDPLLMGPDGNLYGTTTHGGPGGGGTIFRIVLTPHLGGIARLANGNVSLTGTGPSGSPFQLWASTDPSAPVSFWTLLTTGIFAADGTFSFTDTGAANMAARFYRVSTP